MCCVCLQEFLEIRVDWNAGLTWKISRRWAEIRAFHAELSSLIDLPPMPQKAFFRKREEEIAGFNRMFQQIVDSEQARKSTNMHTFIQAAEKMPQAQLHVPEVSVWILLDKRRGWERRVNYHSHTRTHTPSLLSLCSRSVLCSHLTFPPLGVDASV